MSVKLGVQLFGAGLACHRHAIKSGYKECVLSTTFYPNYGVIVIIGDCTEGPLALKLPSFKVTVT